MHPPSAARPTPLPEPSLAIIGECPAMLAAVTSLARVAGTMATVLLTGETGTGKELCARVLHRSSARAGGPFVAVDCAATPEPRLDGELFGVAPTADAAPALEPGSARRHAGRAERASGGTLFLREVAGMGLGVQERLLRALEARELAHPAPAPPIPLDVRVVAATRHDLRAAVAAGRFRADLYERLAVVVIALPPLRERGDDIRLLAEHCVSQSACTHGGPARAIARETLELLLAHPWPGNVPQLCHAVERAALLAEGPVLLPAHLPLEIRAPAAGFVRAADRGTEREAERASPALAAAALAAPLAPGDGGLLPLEELERRHIVQALALTRGQLARAAELLGIHRNTLRRKLQEYGLGDGGPEERQPAELAVPLGGALKLPREVS